MGEFGVIYVAFGSPYLAMAMLSRKTLRQTNPDIPACIVTNVSPTSPEGFSEWSDQDHWIYVEADTSGNRIFKTSIYSYAPFEKTLYLDCDTLVTGDLTDASIYLDYFDLCVKMKPHPLRGGVPILGGRLSTDRAPHWNGGVFCFRKNEKSARFFQLWEEAFSAGDGPRDQTSLAQAIFASDCRLLSLDASWNFTERRFATLDRPQDIRIVHYMSWINPSVRRELELASRLLGAPRSEMDIFLSKRMAQRRRRGGAIGSFLFTLRGYCSAPRTIFPQQTR